MTPAEDAYAYATSYCSTAERCTKDLLDKLTRYALNEAETQTILKRLNEEGFLNEARYAKAYVNDAFTFNKWGRLKIRQGLRMKGLPERLIIEALDTLDEEAYASTLLTLLRQKQRQLPGKHGQDVRGRLYRFALGRGFESGVILAGLKGMMPETAADNED